MFPIYSAIICVIIFVAFDVYYSFFSFVTVLYGIVGALFGLCVGFFITIVVSSAFSAVAPDQIQPDYRETIPILSMQEVFGAEGESHLLRGNFSGKQKYMFIKQNETGRMKGVLVNVDDAFINYTSDEVEPHAQSWRIVYKNKALNHLFFDINLYYTFYIPNTSIVMDFSQVEF